MSPSLSNLSNPRTQKSLPTVSLGWNQSISLLSVVFLTEVTSKGKAMVFHPTLLPDIAPIEGVVVKLIFSAVKVLGTKKSQLSRSVTFSAYVPFTTLAFDNPSGIV